MKCYFGLILAHFCVILALFWPQTCMFLPFLGLKVVYYLLIINIILIKVHTDVCFMPFIMFLEEKYKFLEFWDPMAVRNSCAISAVLQICLGRICCICFYFTIEICILRHVEIINILNHLLLTVLGKDSYCQHSIKNCLGS